MCFLFEGFTVYTKEATGTTQGLLVHLSKLTLRHDSANQRDAASSTWGEPEQSRGLSKGQVQVTTHTDSAATCWSSYCDYTGGMG